MTVLRGGRRGWPRKRRRLKQRWGEFAAILCGCGGEQLGEVSERNPVLRVQLCHGVLLVVVAVSSRGLHGVVRLRGGCSADRCVANAAALFRGLFTRCTLAHLQGANWSASAAYAT